MDIKKKQFLMELAIIFAILGLTIALAYNGIDFWIYSSVGIVLLLIENAAIKKLEKNGKCSNNKNIIPWWVGIIAYFVADIVRVITGLSSLKYILGGLFLIIYIIIEYRGNFATKVSVK